MAHKLPRPPARGHANTDDTGAGAKSPAPSHVPPHIAHMTRHDAKLVNLDTGTFMPANHPPDMPLPKIHPGNRPQVGPLTVIFASSHGHPPMRFGDHAKQGTTVHKHIRGKSRPHPNAVAIEITGRMKLPKPPKKGAREGSAAEEAAESPAEERAEQRAGTDKRKAA